MLPPHGALVTEASARVECVSCELRHDEECVFLCTNVIVIFCIINNLLLSKFVFK